MSHPGLDFSVARYFLFWAPTTPSWNFSVGHPFWNCSRVNSLNFGVPMESKTSKLPKGLVLGKDENIHIRLIGSIPMDDSSSSSSSLLPLGMNQLNGNLQSGQEAKHFWVAISRDKASENHRA
ncbi:hypothetical protein DVH24_001584 [Malus domestica]|uniref:Uncharacterized protein n=1 Tax=Malus domestica TaxID=3750 RepID=A0A498JZL8_MALDO|nr:hypothetical protein DVH24_001584 [Malus domestica]